MLTFWEICSLHKIQKMMLPLSLLAIIILFYAWSGVVIFHNSPEGEAAFPNLADGMWYVLAATYLLLHVLFRLTNYAVENVNRAFPIQDIVDMCYDCELSGCHDAIIQHI